MAAFECRAGYFKHHLQLFCVRIWFAAVLLSATKFPLAAAVDLFDFGIDNGDMSLSRTDEDATLAMHSDVPYTFFDRPRSSISVSCVNF